MRYIKAVATTYFVGQDQDYYKAFPDETDDLEIDRWACDKAQENADDWYGSMDYEREGYESEEEWEEVFYSSAGYDWEEITKEEYEYENWDE